MAKTLTEIEKEIKALEVEKQKVLKESRKDIIKELKKTISQYGITTEELFKTNNTEKKKAMYANPDFPEQTWSGIGRQPAWVKGFIDLHGSLDKALIK
ncbi:H-NS family nucleoid-associated regulatory protein [Methylophilus methylotrophus]|uniref:H-NS histone family protein n=1 Tax=Methylophilus methylotrophus TaxID=17 RepID=UPI00035C45DD|nr:H-NS histone family protein [Methylophilus methylotrophus]